MKPPITYYGGKQMLGKKLVSLIPENKVYVEPFAGSASLMFLKEPNENAAEVINDHDLRLHNFYRVLQDPIKSCELINLLRYSPYSRFLHEEAKRVNKSYSRDKQVMRAYYYFIDLMMSFNHTLGGGWSRTWLQKTTKTFFNKVHLLEACVERLQGVYIESNDAIACIDRWDSKDTFFYIDPPYIGANQGHYSGYKQDSFDALINRLKGIKGKFLLSHYDMPMPESWHKFEFPVKCTSAKQKERVECVWSNFEVNDGYSVKAR